MRFLRRAAGAVFIAAAMMAAPGASALDIVLTNDDGFESALTYAVYQRLQAGGHRMLISGPNFGNNTGLINNSSGTVNAVLIAINRGIPAIAVSAADPTTYRSLRAGFQPVDLEIADVVVRLVGALERGASGRHRADALLPSGIGLNVNLPRFAAGAGGTLPFRLSEVGTAPRVTPVFLNDMCADATAKALLGAACAGASPPKLSGVGLVFNGAPFPAGLSSITDNDPRSE